jgi:hypothetical protein
MESIMRTPLQGVYNIIRFNWHFYAVAGAGVIAFFISGSILENVPGWICIFLAIAIVSTSVISLLVSYYVYDASGLYNFTWMKDVIKENSPAIINIHAGFDETSLILKSMFPGSTIKIFDFYDPIKHTERSIERARRAYAPIEGTKKITTGELPVAALSTNVIFNIFALHEIRTSTERLEFLKLQAKVLTAEGRIVVVEHMRDLPNFLAYNVGFFHFFPEQEWSDNFSRADLSIERKIKISPFITAFILMKSNGTTS